LSEPASESKAGKPPAFAALQHRDFRVYFIGTMLTMMADNIEHVISYWMIYQKFHSPSLAGFAVISHWAPFLIFSMYSGYLADRFDPRRIIQVGLGMFMLASLAWGILFVTDTIEAWHAVVILSVHGLAGALWSPSNQLLIHDIVGREHLQSAVRMNAMARNLGQIAGPAIGAGLMLLVTPKYGILINMLFYLPLTLWLRNAPYGPRFRKEGATAPPRRSEGGFGDIMATLREVSGNRVIFSMILLAGSYSLFVGNAHNAQMPEFATDLGHGDAGILYSLLLAANALGALTAGLLLESSGVAARRPSTACILMMIWCCCIIGFAASTWYPLSLALLFCAGMLDLAFNSTSQAVVQLKAPPELRGRVIGLYQMFANGLRSFAGVTVGIGGGLIGIHWSLGLSALTLFMVGGFLFLFITRPQVAPAPGD
jgi:MFS family permease